MSQRGRGQLEHELAMFRCRRVSITWGLALLCSSSVPPRKLCDRKPEKPSTQAFVVPSFPTEGKLGQPLPGEKSPPNRRLECSAFEPRESWGGHLRSSAC